MGISAPPPAVRPMPQPGLPPLSCFNSFHFRPYCVHKLLFSYFFVKKLTHYCNIKYKKREKTKNTCNSITIHAKNVNIFLALRHFWVYICVLHTWVYVWYKILYTAFSFNILSPAFPTSFKGIIFNGFVIFHKLNILWVSNHSPIDEYLLVFPCYMLHIILA